MNKTKKFLEKIVSKSSIINLILGIVLLLSLVIIFHNPYNRYAILAGCTCCGLVNMFNGLKMMQGTKNKQMGMSYLMLGAIIIVAGFIVIQYVKNR